MSVWSVRLCLLWWLAAARSVAALLLTALSAEGAPGAPGGGVMRRLVGSGFRAEIGEALDRLPPRIRERVGHADLLCGVDPVFAGLTAGRKTQDGRSFRDTAHVVYRHGQVHLPARRRRTTIALPAARDCPAVYLVHEFGHVLDEATGFTLHATPCTDYARSNRYEAFAEAFTAWVGSTWYRSALDRLRRTDPAALAFFDGLAA